jgi:hypothetical protein
MCCFFITLFAFGPRIAFLILWLRRPAEILLVFQSWIWPVLGLLFLPWTTLAYLLVYGTNGIVGLDFVWLGLAVFADLGTYSSGAYKRKQVSGYRGP